MEFDNLLQVLSAPTFFTWKMAIMMIASGVLIYLGIAKDYEPVLLIPIGSGRSF